MRSDFFSWDETRQEMKAALMKWDWIFMRQNISSWFFNQSICSMSRDSSHRSTCYKFMLWNKSKIQWVKEFIIKQKNLDKAIIIQILRFEISDLSDWLTEKNDMILTKIIMWFIVIWFIVTWLLTAQLLSNFRVWDFWFVRLFDRKKWHDFDKNCNVIHWFIIIWLFFVLKIQHLLFWS